MDELMRGAEGYLRTWAGTRGHTTPYAPLVRGYRPSGTGWRNASGSRSGHRPAWGQRDRADEMGTHARH
ncbi:hypothetical protein J7F03_16180 [Streptomyces sp. ISL-43]|uniref:hypothetical protein n=1 Tax=Streptomyces sp. ISL-43 TaxID=2819183 RepID=UPI001BE5BB9B|nr:hypothetical protein [Streptomyces sp. ISL-43]MBT2448599.1 hypothetical protein [Streptomyces sp. ISL-43]